MAEPSAERAGEAEIASLCRAAEDGEIGAQNRLAWQFLGHPPYQLRNGLALADSAAKAGHPEAPYLLALYSALGVGLHQNWSNAVALLLLSAERGYGRAQAELAALAGRWDLALELARSSAKSPETAPATWKQFHDAVDLGAWLTAPQPKPQSISPRVATLEAFASNEICDWLIARARPRMVPATTIDIYNGDARSDQSRTNSHYNFPVAETDFVLLFLRARIAQATGAPHGAFEHTTMLHYRVGEQFFPHFDYLDPNLPGYREELRDGGQRALTFLVYMNDGFEGGATDFPTAGQRYKGNKGDALFFWNVDWNGTPDPRTLHAGLPPSAGEKWLLSQWIRDRSLIPDRF